MNVTIRLLESFGHKVVLKGSIYTSMQTVAPAEINAVGN